MSNTQDFNNNNASNLNANSREAGINGSGSVDPTAVAAPTGPAAVPATPLVPAQDAVRSMRYWLKAVDGLSGREIQERFAGAGASRRDLRVLNLLASDREIPEPLRARLERNGKRLWSLADRGWIVRQAPTKASSSGAASTLGWKLTEAGEAARARLTQITLDVREQVSGSVSPEALATTIESLEAMARELGWTEDMRIPRGGGGRRRGGPAFGRGHGHRDGHGHREPHGRGDGRGRWQEQDLERGRCCKREHASGQAREAHQGRRGGHPRGGAQPYAHGWGASQRHDHGRPQHHTGRRESFERGFAAGFTAARTDA